ncbi:MauE/DoxX family redox-associated membrane protein [Isoptericola sp. b441]|uniref:MauE/DoxX family redox-associated membrane protein n=1 Tax=Actinotalea lenta TaxID=3064654 RepID=A0ABT9D862_9CELL|nr:MULTISPECIES: MauE/DoxX family redox-associated membrane protein [unclassified Isoptericola]MDO8106641.1 MauE/DoxX family redox-associated membrane protein [Isoptericola sp. b441]MDO8121651.1 MauE/DoxX family redox-associated membrane protein [Isoptericola sp. b490]
MSDPDPVLPAGRWATARPWVSTVVRLALAVVSLWAGLAKAGDLAASVRAVRAFELLPEALARPVGYGLPAVEIVVGVLLLLGLVTRYAAAIMGLLMLAFIVGIASAWARGLSIDCGCFGGGGATSPDLTQYPWEITRDLAIAAGAALLVRWPYSRFSLDQTLGLTRAAQ